MASNSYHNLSLTHYECSNDSAATVELLTNPISFLVSAQMILIFLKEKKQIFFIAIFLYIQIYTAIFYFLLFYYIRGSDLRRSSFNISTPFHKHSLVYRKKNMRNIILPIFFMAFQSVNFWCASHLIIRIRNFYLFIY